MVRQILEVDRYEIDFHDETKLILYIVLEPCLIIHMFSLASDKIQFK